MQTVKLNNGIVMPIIGFGTYQITDHAECELAVKNAIQTGYRLIDTAAVYLNEEAVGKGIKQSGVPREELFVTTKLWVQDQGYETAKSAFDRSMERLGLDYLDLYLIHWPYGDVYGSWKAMEELYEAGKIKAIGVSNFQPDRLMDFLLHNKIAPAVNQVEANPFYQQLDAAVFMKEKGVQIQSWSPFAQGSDAVWTNDVLLGLSKKYGKTVAQIVLRWLIQRDIVVIPKTVNVNRMAENFDVFGFQLTDEEIKAISLLDKKESVLRTPDDPEMVKLISGIKVDI